MKTTFVQHLLLFFGLNFPEVTPFKERVTYLRTSIAIALPFTLVFSLINYLTGFYYLAAIEGVTALLFLVPALLFGHHENRLGLAEYLVLIYGICVTLALVVFGGIAGTGTLWIFAFPFIAFLLKGQKTGWYMSIFWMLIMSIVLSYGPDANVFYPYPEGFTEQLVLAMLFFSLIAAAFNLARSRFEILLVEQIKRVEEENRFKSEFLANVSHEIRTPMNAIYNLVDFALETPDKNQKNLHLTKLKTSTKRLLNLLNNILDFSRLEKNEAVLDFTAINIRDELANIDNLLSASCKTRQLLLETEISPDVPEILVGDPVKLHQVLFNVISNAIKFTPEHGRITVSCKTVTLDSSTVTLLFSIKDTGIGMTEEQLKIIFDCFKQANASTSRRFGGSGLGLAIVKQLVNLMQGKIWVKSRIKAGTTFFIELPFDRPAQKLQLQPDPQHQATADTEADYPRLKGLKVLLVEDDEINQYVATEILQRVGIHVATADNGRAALDLLENDSEFDAILMDINMPVMDGFEATREIRRLIPLRHKPIIGLTANVLPEDRAKAIDAGMNTTLGKPIFKHDLMRSLEKHLFGQAAGVKDTPSTLTESQHALLNIEGLNLLDSFLVKNPELLNNILLLFADKYASFAHDARQLIALQDYENLRIMAHSLKGNLATFGMKQLSEQAFKLEKACSDEHQHCETLLSAIQPKLDDFICQINAVCQTLDNEEDH